MTYRNSSRSLKQVRCQLSQTGQLPFSSSTEASSAGARFTLVDHAPAVAYPLSTTHSEPPCQYASA